MFSSLDNQPLHRLLFADKRDIMHRDALLISR
ncbi:hypothetical protein EDF82_1855 [Raoultella sp. BIGb0399]|nr:hypothetical protein EDF82_1855 [Raoultella sp. BIGb0399]